MRPRLTLLLLVAWLSLCGCHARLMGETAPAVAPRPAPLSVEEMRMRAYAFPTKAEEIELFRARLRDEYLELRPQPPVRTREPTRDLPIPERLLPRKLRPCKSRS